MPVPACESRRACEGASSEAEVSPRARRNPLEGGVSPRARRDLLEGAFDWATPVGRGGHRGVGRARCVCLSKRCVLFLFFAGFKQDSPGCLGDLRAVPDRHLLPFSSVLCRGCKHGFASQICNALLDFALGNELTLPEFPLFLNSQLSQLCLS
jgi:hypothetical protein